MYTWEECQKIKNVLDSYDLSDILNSCINSEDRTPYDIRSKIIEIHPELKKLKDFSIYSLTLYLQTAYTAKFYHIDMYILINESEKIKRRSENDD